MIINRRRRPSLEDIEQVQIETLYRTEELTRRKYEALKKQLCSIDQYSTSDYSSAYVNKPGKSAQSSTSAYTNQISYHPMGKPGPNTSSPAYGSKSEPPTNDNLVDNVTRIRQLLQDIILVHEDPEGINLRSIEQARMEQGRPAIAGLVIKYPGLFNQAFVSYGFDGKMEWCNGNSKPWTPTDTAYFRSFWRDINIACMSTIPFGERSVGPISVEQEQHSSITSVHRLPSRFGVNSPTPRPQGSVKPAPIRVDYSPLVAGSDSATSRLYLRPNSSKGEQTPTRSEIDVVAAAAAEQEMRRLEEVKKSMIKSKEREEAQDLMIARMEAAKAAEAKAKAEAEAAKAEVRAKVMAQVEVVAPKLSGVQPKRKNVKGKTSRKVLGHVSSLGSSYDQADHRLPSYFAIDPTIWTISC